MTRSIGWRIAERLRWAIITGALAPKRPLVCRTLAQRWGVSATAVREALRILQAEGLVAARYGRTPTVAAMSGSDLSGIIRMRRGIEPGLAAQACLSLSSARLEALHQHTIAALATHAAHSDDPAQYEQSCVQAQHELMLGLLATAADGWRLRILPALWHATQRYLCAGLDLTNPAGYDITQLATAEHELLTGYRTRQPHHAQGAMLRYLAWTHSAATRALTRRPPPTLSSADTAVARKEPPLTSLLIRHTEQSRETDEAARLKQAG